MSRNCPQVSPPLNEPFARGQEQVMAAVQSCVSQQIQFTNEIRLLPIKSFPDYSLFII